MEAPGPLDDNIASKCRELATSIRLEGDARTRLQYCTRKVLLAFKEAFDLSASFKARRQNPPAPPARWTPKAHSL